jgi:hypothetical protein
LWLIATIGAKWQIWGGTEKKKKTLALREKGELKASERERERERENEGAAISSHGILCFF